MKNSFWAPVLTFVLFSALAGNSLLAQTVPAKHQPLVYIRGSGALSVSGASFFGMSSASIGKHDETIEMAHELLKTCPETSLTVSDATSKIDYEFILHRQDHISQVMLLRFSDKTVLWSNKKGTVAKAVRDGCKAIMADWKQQSVSPAAATQSPELPHEWWQSDKPKPTTEAKQ